MHSDSMDKLKEIVVSCGSVLVALSGGSDSSVLAVIAAEALGRRCAAATVLTELFPSVEKKAVVRLVAEQGIDHVFLEESLLSRPAIKGNPTDRCYHCKLVAGQRLLACARDRGLDTVLDGTTCDDLHEHRPGLKAAEQLGIRSPYVEAGMGKEDVLSLAEELGLGRCLRPPNTCLATRIPFGVELSSEKLEMVDRAETALLNAGFRMIRVRFHQPQTARVEVGREEIGKLISMRDRLVEELKSIGFLHVSVDLEGYRRS